MSASSCTSAYNTASASSDSSSVRLAKNSPHSVPTAFPPQFLSDRRTPQSLSYSASIALPVSHMRSRASSEASSSQTPIQIA